MAGLPTGTVTFFFSDIEGSTRLLETLGDAYAVALERHREIVRAAFARSGATELGTEGDSFFAVFPSARDAVVAAVDIQREMAAEDWPHGASLRARIGLHSGEASLSGGGYVGMDVHRAARIMAAAHGGQILISEATRALVDRSLASGIEIRDLGEHRLRDISAPEWLSQATANGLQADFPPLRTLSAFTTNLPPQTSALVGRELELDAIRRHFDSATVRIVTLTGPGGIGKTTLAIRAAADHLDRSRDGVFFADLSGARSAPAALEAMVQAVGIAVASGDQLRDALTQHLRSRHVLLLLDNFEQVMSASDDVVELVGVCSNLKVLITSREALRVRGEQVLPVAPLSLPEPSVSRATAEELSGYAAVRLFVARAQEVRPGFVLTDENAPAVAEICAGLDGLPLAIELAAARLTIFSPQELRDRLGRKLEVLGRGARDLPARQQTLRSTIEWSYEILDDDERSVFHLLSLFSTARMETVEQVAAKIEPLATIDVLDRLGSLIDKNLIRSVGDDHGRRLSMLDTIRSYAAERLASDPALRTAGRRAQAEYFAEFADRAHADLRGAGRDATIDSLASELGNLQTAWRYFVEAADLAPLSKLLEVLWALHDARGWYHGAATLANDLLGVLSNTPPAPDRADEEITLRMTLARAMLALSGYSDEVEELYRGALELADAAGGVPMRLPVLRSLASFYLYRAEIDKTAVIGRQMLDLAKQENDRSLEVEGHLILGPATFFMGGGEAGLDHLERAIALFDPKRDGRAHLRLGPNPGVAAGVLAGLISWLLGYPDKAAERSASALELAERLKHPYSLAYGTFHVALIDLWSGRLDAAHGRAQAVIKIAEEHDYQIWKAIGLTLHGVTSAALGDPDTGLEETGRGIAMYENLRTPPVFWHAILSLRAEACGLAGRWTEALDVIDQAASVSHEGTFDAAAVKIQKADVLVALDDPDRAKSLLIRALGDARGAGVRMLQLRAATRLARLARPESRPEAIRVLREIADTFTEGADSIDVMEAQAVLGQTR
jgi:predicted ATPase/class 3 adenylate cyclase